MQKLLIANRGEVAVRIARAAADCNLRSVAVFSEDDADGGQREHSDESLALRGAGPAAYLDLDQILSAAVSSGCDALHPGWGFLSENPELARRCESAGLTFVGPTADSLKRLGDKVEARRLAIACAVPVVAGTPEAAGIDQIRELMLSLGDDAVIVIKAVAGGGGRGMRIVRSLNELPDAFDRCTSEAVRAFGNGNVYAEQLLPRVRHLEVQIVGDGQTAVALGERECSLQRRFQKLIEIAPSPWLSPDLRRQLLRAAVAMAEAIQYRSLGTFEFLLAEDGAFAFIEANPRLQVEHTVTEEAWGLDLVRVQLDIAAGARLRDLSLPQTNRGYAVQARLNAETMAPDGRARPATGTVSDLHLPGGRGIRIDSALRVGQSIRAAFDPLLLKLICRTESDDFSELLRRLQRALLELHVGGVANNRDFLLDLLAQPELATGAIHTGFVEERLAAGSLLAQDTLLSEHDGPIRAPMQATVVAVLVSSGDRVRTGQALAVLSAMKMEHVIEAASGGVVSEVAIVAGQTVTEGAILMRIASGTVANDAVEVDTALDPSELRADLIEVRDRQHQRLDSARAESVARRHQKGQRTARENIADLCDPDSFIEYGGLVIAAQRQRRSKEELIERTPADGLVAGIGRINGEQFGADNSQCAVLSYDYMVLAGTQGYHNHRKKDRLFELVERLRLPVVFFTEGGGGRPGDTDAPGVAGLDCLAFHLFARLSGLVPLVGVNSGRCFAGNAALLGCCDVVIATRNSNIGMGGPAMIEGGGLGSFRPEEIGPISVQTGNGVVDIAVADEAEAVRVARRYLGYFQGNLRDWQCRDQAALRQAIPANRLRVYDVRRLIETLVDDESLLELRPDFGIGMITAFARVEGRPLGILANNPKHLAGAIDAAGADKAARFMQLCDAFDLPILFLCDTPGIMVGPEAEKSALVRHCSRMFVVGSNLSVPFGTIVLRKSYGLGAQAMGGGSHKAPLFTVAWPTGEFGGMGLEGAVKLGFRRELDAIEDSAARQRAFAAMVARAYEHGKALNTATHFEIDDVIDPADSRRWVREILLGAPKPVRQGKKRPCVDTW